MNEKYQVDTSTKLGSGMYGTVYKARNIQTNQNVAMKRANSMSFVEQEINIMKAVGKHRNILQLFDHYEQPNGVWLALEFCDLGDLQHYMTKKPNIDLAVSFVHQSALGLQFLHTRSSPVIHRDLKPPNILLQNEGNNSITVKLADFGLSKEGGEGISPEEWILSTDKGTMLYKAPEFWNISNRRIRYTVSVDVFALGLVLEVLVHIGQGLTTEPLPAKVFQQESGNYFAIGQLMHEEKTSHDIVKFVKEDTHKHIECKKLITQMTQYESHKRITLGDVITRLEELKGISENVDQSVECVSTTEASNLFVDGWVSGVQTQIRKLALSG